MKDKQTKETDKLIKGIQKITPVAISFKSLVYDRDTVSVDGFSKDQQSIEVLWANLRESDKYTNCHISNRNAVDGGYSFVLNITLPKVQEEIKSEGGNN